MLCLFASVSITLVNVCLMPYVLDHKFWFCTMSCRNMLQGPWREANAPILTLHVDDNNVNGEAVTIALAYLYGHHPTLTDNNAFRVLAAASFLDLQVLTNLWSLAMVI